MFAGIDIASERHVLARLDSSGKAIGRPIAFGEDQDGYRRLAEALGPPPVLVAMGATGHCRKNLFAVLTAAGHEVALLNPFTARRFQDASLERTRTDTIDAEGLARLAFEKRPAPTQLHDGRHRRATDGVDGSRSRHRDVPHWVLSHLPMKGAIHEGDCHGRARSGQERVPCSRG